MRRPRHPRTARRRLIALNELAGSSATVPWSASTQTYRANVLALVQGLAAHGARPFLLVPWNANTVIADAPDWWRQLATFADVVPEVYLGAPLIWKQGAVVGSRTARLAMRRAIAAFEGVGVPAQRLGLVLGFQSAAGTGGREGLQPLSAWLEVVKLQTLAAQQVASDSAIASIWSWGWGTFSSAGADPDKATAACVYLWTRDPTLCDAPTIAGPSFTPTRDDGLINLSPGQVCQWAGGAISQADIASATLLTGSSSRALDLLFERGVESARATVTAAAVARRARHHRPRLRWRSCRLPVRARQCGVDLTTARAGIADLIRRRLVATTLPTGHLTARNVRAYVSTHPYVLTRRVRANQVVPWLGNHRTGVALRRSPEKSPDRHAATPRHHYEHPGDRRAADARPSPRVRQRGAQGCHAWNHLSPCIGRARGRDTAGALARDESTALATTVCASDTLPHGGVAPFLPQLSFLRLDS